MEPVKPISFIEFGQCLNCLKPSLVLIQREIGSTCINLDGTLGSHNNDYYESKIFCTNCNSEFDFIKAGFRYKPVSSMVYEQMKREAMSGTNKFKFDIKNPFAKE